MKDKVEIKNYESVLNSNICKLLKRTKFNLQLNDSRHNGHKTLQLINSGPFNFNFTFHINFTDIQRKISCDILGFKIIYEAAPSFSMRLKIEYSWTVTITHGKL